MSWKQALILAALAAGCSKADETDIIEGTVNVESHGHSAAIAWDTALSYASGDRLLVFLTGAQDASCSAIADYLGPNEGAVPKDGVLEGGSCTLTLVVEGWGGRSSESWGSESTEGYNPGLSSVLRCDFGEGEWVLETRAGEYEDYYWSGDVWAGAPSVFSWAISDDGDGVKLDLSFSEFDGNFPYQTDLERYPATADISGEMVTTECEDLASATLL